MINPAEAIMFVAPVPLLVAKAAALMVDTDGAVEVQVTRLVTFWVDPSVKIPVAANCCVVPSGIDALVGVIEMDTSCAGETVRVVPADTVPTEAVMVAEPTARAEASPVAETVVTPADDDDQCAVEVRFCVLPSEYVPVTVNCCVVPTDIAALAGVTLSDTKVRWEATPVPVKLTTCGLLVALSVTVKVPL